MDDLKFGAHNKRGDFTPSATLELAPFWAWPPQVAKVFAWIPGYFWPWNAFHMATALAYWWFVVPDVETMRTMSWGWSLRLYAANGAAIFILYGAVELAYYVKRKQGTRFKFNGKSPPTILLKSFGSRVRTPIMSCGLT
jgi:hypothetical protein